MFGLRGVTKTPIYCAKCGKDLIRIQRLSGYDIYTAERQYRISLACPEWDFDKVFKNRWEQKHSAFMWYQPEDKEQKGYWSDSNRLYP